MAEQELHGSQVTCASIDHGHFRPTQRMGAEQFGIETNAHEPIRKKSRILAGRDAPSCTTVAGEEEFTQLLSRDLQIVVDRFASLVRQLELDRTSRLLLPNRRPIDGVSPRGDIVHLKGNDITAAQLAVDGQVEHRQVSGATLYLQSRPYRPDVFRSERRLRTDQPS